MQEIIRWLFYSDAGIAALLLGICSSLAIWFIFWVRNDEKKRKKRIMRSKLGIERPNYLKKKYWE